MSTFVQETFACPQCGGEQTASVAKGLNAERTPEAIEQILEGTFQRLECPCGATFHAESPFILVDFPGHVWFGVYPLVDEPRWAKLEGEAHEAWRRNVAVHAPKFIRDDADAFVVRSVFGLDALREKLLCAYENLDDVLLEAFKITLMTSGAAGGLGPEWRPRLLRAGFTTLEFGLESGEVLQVPTAALTGLDPADYTALRAQLTEGSWVDVGRLMVDA